MKHNSHPHELYVASNIPFENQTRSCFACKLPIYGTCHACPPCDFYLHKFCFELPQSAHFDSHKKHALGLLYPPYRKGSNCDACGEPCDGFSYNCAPCKYNIHSSCATLLNPRDPKSERDQYVAMAFRHTVSAIKSLKNHLDSAKSEQQMEMEAELERRKHNLWTQQMKQASDSITFMGQIGTSNYTVRYI